MWFSGMPAPLTFTATIASAGLTMVWSGWASVSTPPFMPPTRDPV
jgi:hypothetical protein